MAKERPPFISTQAMPAAGVSSTQLPAAAVPLVGEGTSHRGLHVVCFLTLTALAAAAIETPQSSTTHAGEFAPHQKAARPAATVQDRAVGSSRRAPARPSKVEDNPHAEEQAGSQTGGLSPEALQSFRSQMQDLQEQAEQLHARAGTAKASLSSLKAEMASQGVGLRSDVLEAEAQMNHRLEQAQREISSGDAVSAEHDLQIAGYAIEFIEKFLGR